MPSSGKGRSDFGWPARQSVVGVVVASSNGNIHVELSSGSFAVGDAVAVCVDENVRAIKARLEGVDRRVELYDSTAPGKVLYDQYGRPTVRITQCQVTAEAGQRFTVAIDGELAI
jgi:hypothetical protein